MYRSCLLFFILHQFYVICYSVEKNDDLMPNDYIGKKSKTHISDDHNNMTIDICGDGEINGIHYKLRSPNYPNDYFDNLLCIKYIRIPENSRIILVAADFNLERGFRSWFTRKPNDYLQINDGPLFSGDLSGVILLDSMEQNHTIKFVTDYANSWKTYRGFDIDIWVWNPKQSTDNEITKEYSSLARIAPDVSDKPEKNRNVCFAIGLISIVIILILLTIMSFGYIRHRNATVQMKQFLLQSIDELAQRMILYSSLHKPNTETSTELPSNDLELNAENIESKEQLLKKIPKRNQKESSVYDEIVNHSTSQRGFQGTSNTLSTNRDTLPSYEDLKYQKKS